MSNPKCQEEQDCTFLKIKSRLSADDVVKVTTAYRVAEKAHSGQYRDSGESYFKHPLAVAGVVSDLGMDTETIIAALLHDTVEDTSLTLKDIEGAFGSVVAKLVDGVTKLSKINFESDNVKQAENLRKLLLALSKDIRVLIVKLADRLHNMQTIDYIESSAKKTRKAAETLEIYAPLAGRTGLHQLKLDLQDMAFEVLYPDVRKSIMTRLYKIQEQDTGYIDKMTFQLEKILTKHNINVKIFGREKTPYSIWMKMQNKNASFDQLSDVIAFRVIVNTMEDCYQALGFIHSYYKMVPDTFQDFISVPKKNGYQSLHTIVIGPFQQRIEVQIRTEQMHQIAEYGVAAHWSYKQFSNMTSESQYQWVQELLQILDHSGNPEDFLYNTKLAMYYDTVFCFTPKGHIVSLPKDATVVDFAYYVDSNLGNKCTGALVNNRSVPVNHILNNGDQVNILTSSKQRPSVSWINFIVTGKARSKIHQFVKKYEGKEYTKLGQLLVKSISTLDDELEFDKAMNNVLQIQNKQKIDELYSDVGRAITAREDLIKYFGNKGRKEIAAANVTQYSNQRLVMKDSSQSKPVPIDGLLPGVAIHFANCCYPIKGDKIIGVLAKKLEVHRLDCPSIEESCLLQDNIIPLTWSNTGRVSDATKIKCIVKNEIGAIARMTSSIAKDNCNIINMIITYREEAFCEVIVYIRVDNEKHLKRLLANLKLIKSVDAVLKLEE